MTSSLAQQVILITGASAGIGATLAQQLAQQYSGVRLVLAARSVDKLEQVATQCRQLGADALTVPTNMTETAQIEALAHTALEKFGRVDALINNAGYGQMGPVELIQPEVIRRQLEVNVVGVITLTQALIPAMRSQGGGRIINLSSIAGQVAFPFSGIYNASKFALEGVSDALRMELAPFNIQVSLIEPGPVQTEFFDVARQQAEQALSVSHETPYQPAIEKLEEVAEQMSSQAWSAEQVATVIIKALSDRHPRSRYVAATYGRPLLLLLKFLPTAWVDRLWQRTYKIDLITQAWQQK
ncbi:MAG: SDR family oxidoreductase [Cyanothece sp. SIO1E1]|nr:SDR family oxidoreductase [Cyanothece sp. SIO1E1]